MAPGERNIFNKILLAEANETEIINGIKMLSKIMSNYHNKPVMLFLDEYDVPLQNRLLSCPFLFLLFRSRH